MKLDKYASARLSGMDYALRKIKEDGIEAFEKEMQVRTATGVSFPATKQEASFYQHYAIRCILTMMIYCLHDHYGFGAKRCQDIMNLFNDRCSEIVSGLVSWTEIEDALSEELGFKVRVG